MRETGEHCLAFAFLASLLVLHFRSPSCELRKVYNTLNDIINCSVYLFLVAARLLGTLNCILINILFDTGETDQVEFK